MFELRIWKQYMGEMYEYGDKMRWLLS